MTLEVHIASSELKNDHYICIMTAIKRLAGQTAIYGIPSVLGRVLGYLLVRLYTGVLIPEEYGTVSVFYSYASLLMVILTYGMETAFFRFHEKEVEKEKVFSTAMISLIFSSVLFLVLTSFSAGSVARWIDYPQHPEFIVWFAWILALDALSSIPFANLRALNRPVRFAWIKMTNIVLNIVLNLFFLLLCPFVIRDFPDTVTGKLISVIYKPDWSIEYIFISNLIASIVTFIMLVPQIFILRWKLEPHLWKKMILYAFPLLFAGMAGIVNETFDRLLLRYLLPENISSYQVGIYAACYKISILMTIFIQAYKYAAEPFFFAQAKEKNAREVYARIMDYFIITVSLIFLGTLLYLDDFFLPVLVDVKYWEGRGVIPILMMANLFLGVYYNLSIWYKLTGKTSWGAWLSLFGAIITLALNFWWIPLSSDHLVYGYYGSAWATFICYGAMMILSYLIGQKYFPVKYNLTKFFGYLGLSVLLYGISTIFTPDTFIIRVAFHTLLLFVFLAITYLVEKPRLTQL
jgi:O-antigen/teichoic acid export membrane protein